MYFAETMDGWIRRGRVSSAVRVTVFLSLYFFLQRFIKTLFTNTQTHAHAQSVFDDAGTAESKNSLLFGLQIRWYWSCPMRL